MDDTKIVELFLARDEASIKMAAEKYGHRLRLLSYGIVGDMQTAEECENDTYLEAWKSIPPNEPKDYLYAFLARITRHISLNCCRDRARLKRSAFICELSSEMEECIPLSSGGDGFIDDFLLGEALNGFLGKLDEEKRSIFIRRYWFFDSIDDISKRFGISESKVKAVLFRSRIKLKKHLEKEGYII